MSRFLTLCIVLCLSLCSPRRASAEPRFTKPPTVQTSGDKTRITFAVSEPTDAAVFIEDAKGNIVRHLAAGVLGENPPPPFQPRSLEQSLRWDGKADYGRPAGAGPFRVRVALALHADRAEPIMHDSQCLGRIRALAVGDDGALYVLDTFGGNVPNWDGWRLIALDRRGAYRRTLLPPPADTSRDQWHALGAATVDLDGLVSPVYASVPHRSFFPREINRRTALAGVPGGGLVMLTADASLAAIKTSGAAAEGGFLGPPLLPDARRPGLARLPFLAVSPEGKWAYLSGLERERRKPLSAVYRVPLATRTGAEPFFGQPGETGADLAHLGGQPHGLALDGAGQLLVADHAGDRVLVVRESDGEAVASLDVRRPDALAVDRRTGHVYLTSLLVRGQVKLIKLRSWRKPDVLAERVVPSGGNPDYPWVLALDAADPPVVWLGGDRGQLLRIEDGGDALAEPVEVHSQKFHTGGFVDVQVDRFRPAKEVYVRGRQHVWFRYGEQTGETEMIELNLPGAAGTCIVPGPDGLLYAPSYPYHLLRFDRDGKPAAWPSGYEHYPERHTNSRTREVEETKTLGPHGRFAPVSMTYMTHTLGIRHDGRIFMLDPGLPRMRPPKMLREYAAEPWREAGEPIVWKVSDTAVGPKFDAQGNIYLAEQIKPLGRPAPDEFRELIGEVEVGETYGRLQEGPPNAVLEMYGSIVKFSPRGGTIHWDGKNPYVGEMQLDPSLKTVDAAYYRNGSGRLSPLRITGAEWFRLGVSHVDLTACNCENIRFDVDAFGRVFYPDLGRFRIGVLDTSGNDLAHFGRYGNPDAPAGRIAFGWLTSVGVTDRFLYAGDSLNKRLLQIPLKYAAEATAPID
jgi:hypothetical protein